MTSKGKRTPETRGSYPRCKAIPCKQKEVRDGYCRFHAAFADSYGLSEAVSQPPVKEY